MPHRSRVFKNRVKKTWISSFLHLISNTQKKKKIEEYKPRKRRKNPKKEGSTNPRKEKKKIHSKEEDPRHTQIQSPSSTSRSSIYGTIHDLHHQANDLNKLHTTLKDVNDLKEEAMEERQTRLSLFVDFSTKTASAGLMLMWALLAFCCLGLYWKGSCCFLGFEGLNIC